VYETFNTKHKRRTMKVRVAAAAATFTGNITSHSTHFCDVVTQFKHARAVAPPPLLHIKPVLVII
jgi:hypothetical protein